MNSFEMKGLQFLNCQNYHENPDFTGNFTNVTANKLIIS